MMETIILAIQGITVAALALLGTWIKTTKTQVKNDHGTNLRDDLDRMHKSINDGNAEIMYTLGSHDARIVNLERETYTGAHPIIGKADK